MAIEPHQLERDERDQALHRLASYLRKERDEEWGDLAVRLLFDTFEEQVAPLYFNPGDREGTARDPRVGRRLRREPRGAQADAEAIAGT